MTTIPGASQFLSASTLANTRGLSAQPPTLLGSGSTASLLEAGRATAAGGIGISASARAINNQFLNNGDVNTLFSLAAGPDATIESAQQQILALRAGLTNSQLAPSLQDVPTPLDNGEAAASDLGQEIDESV